MTDLLKVVDINKKFGRVTVLNKVSFTLSLGEKRGIIGPNGAGKTTFINVLTGAIPADSGEIYLNGNRITRLPSYQRARLGIARSFQILSLFGPMTVLETLRHAVLRRRGRHMDMFKRLSAMDQAQDEARAIAHQLGLSDDLHEPSDKLSHGMRRRLDIGLVLAQRPHLLVLDEPAAGLSTTETRELAKLLSALPSHTALILVEHDMEMVYALSEQITVLDYGRVLTEGTPEEINKHPDVRRIYLGEGQI